MWRDRSGADVAASTCETSDKPSPARKQGPYWLGQRKGLHQRPSSTRQTLLRPTPPPGWACSESHEQPVWQQGHTDIKSATSTTLETSASIQVTDVQLPLSGPGLQGSLSREAWSISPGKPKVSVCFRQRRSRVADPAASRTRHCSTQSGSARTESPMRRFSGLGRSRPSQCGIRRAAACNVRATVMDGITSILVTLT